MKPKYYLITLVFIFFVHCSGSATDTSTNTDNPNNSSSDTDNTDTDNSNAGSTDTNNTNSDSTDSGSESQPADSQPVDTTTPCSIADNNFTLSLVGTNQGSITNVTQQPIVLSATHNLPLNAYLLSESGETPSVADPRWVAIPETPNLSIDTTFTFESDGEKSLVFFVKDTCNTVSQASNFFSLTLDTVAPTGALTLNDGAKFTLESNPVVTRHLTASDNASQIVAYMYSSSNTPPLIDNSYWVSVEKTTTIDLSESIALPAPLNHKKFMYAWVKDAAGNISNTISTSIE
ncbi:MAG: hypothetical protein ACD_73C00355G0002, partial [uncultured bacterium]